MVKDLFERIKGNKGPLGKWADKAEGYYVFPKLEGPISNRMFFNGKEVITWSINDYLGLANHPEILKIDGQATAEHGLAYPMGARMMSGHTKYHEQLEQECADFVAKQAAYLVNFGYQGMVSAIDALVSKDDIIVYDVDAHACIIDGVRLHAGKRFVYKYNDIESCEKNLIRASKIAEKTGGGILLISEGVFGMRGEQGCLEEIVALKEKYKFRMLVDDAHGFGTLGEGCRGTGFEQGVQDKIDIYFATFAKAMAGIGAFFAGDKDVIQYLQYNMRSQIFAKSLPVPMVKGVLKRLEIIRNTGPLLQEMLWEITRSLQLGLMNAGFDLGTTQSCITPVYLKGEIPEAMAMVKDLRENHGVFCSIVVYPVIPKGLIILRLIPTLRHSFVDVNQTIKAFTVIREKLEKGIYKKVAQMQIINNNNGKL
ncbi:MAG: aminotransferase class I/II-fold pyridoxal phosphate-dependent enzyme [Tenacibaculum sp.]